MHTAVIEDKALCLKVLIEKGAELEIQDEEGFTPLLMACWMKREEILKLLIQNRASLDVTDKNKRSSIHLSVLRKDEAILSVLLDAKASTALMNSIAI